MRNVIKTRLGFLGRNNVPVYKLDEHETRILKSLMEYDDDPSTDPTIVNRTILYLLYDLRKDHKMFIEAVSPLVDSYKQHLEFMADKSNCDEEAFRKYDALMGRLLKHRETGTTLIKNMKSFKEHISKQTPDHFTKKALGVFKNIKREFIELYEPIYDLTTPQ